MYSHAAQMHYASPPIELQMSLDHLRTNEMCIHLFDESLGLVVNRPHQTENASEIHVKADVA